ncbi:coproporphyrinogen III oxidase [Hymenobacter sp. DH14]|uniref:coproporphyrinogen oxidase n=1 Tax=Hymenobacter cyanobacteriorum TaxID=2926463 RepID=A0A9X1VH94_9BACT|nr:coproporphyrinogen III oxidase [Hymenobacter cyanobacteriorum]MCI1188638.1 coproporphyrinogen III oxidase [Hymenobacter cyanobacteriorum]
MKYDTILPLTFAPRPGAEAWMRQFQDWLCHRLETADGGGHRFRPEEWAHGGGGGTTHTLEQGAVLEKSSVAFAAVWDVMSKPLAQRLRLRDPRYFVASLQAGLHPRSPMVPGAHLHLRYVEAATGEAWFGGSLDLTPTYVDVAQARWFHQQLQEMCGLHDASYYPRFKAGADAHFYLPHRGETRGVGGLYFDRLQVGRDGLFEELLAFVQDVGEVYGRTYGTLMSQNAGRPYAEPEKRWQQLRRGRYAEFSLTMERPEPACRCPQSLVLGLPPRAEWYHHHTPAPGSAEAQTLQWLRPGIDWLHAGAA